MNLFDSVTVLQGVGPKRESQLARLGVVTLLDLLWLLPRAYTDLTQIRPVDQINPDDTVQIRGKVVSARINYVRRGLKIVKAVLEDETGRMVANWFNQPFMLGVLKPGVSVLVTGRTRLSSGGIELAVSAYQKLSDEENESDEPGIVPIYPLTAGLSQKVLRLLIQQALQLSPSYPSTVPASILKQTGLLPAATAFKQIHWPDRLDDAEPARRSLALEELFLLQCKVQEERLALQATGAKGIRHIQNLGMVERVKVQFGRELTRAQSRVLEEILSDMAAPRPMNRLIQGDVGAGKTVVAALALARAAENGFQACMMVPTEVLAGQHYRSLAYLFEGIAPIALLTGNTPASERKCIMEKCAKGQISVLIGTHAVLTETVKFHRLGLIVVDEQHRFGVRQRARLGKKGVLPDVLVMSATPIPRTLALTLYGDLDISVIDELPAGRLPIKTKYLTSQERSRAYRFVLKEIQQGRQAYVICPLVEESENQDTADVGRIYKELSQTVFAGMRVAAVHGRMNPADKDSVMDSFRSGDTKVLISTTVVEVGVDVPNATVMVIEGAERFGLSQLHQLRGRVGRGEHQSYCMLIGAPTTPEAVQRLKTLELTTDGFEIAQQDLRLRGPGDLWGLRQRGLPVLMAANLVTDIDLIEITQRGAQAYMKNKKQLSDTVKRLLEARIRTADVAPN